MVDRPILFSGPMVAAILAGRKSQTRRIVKPQPPAPNGSGEPYFDRHEIGGNNWLYLAGDAPTVDEISHHKCPYGEPGDRLWVREMWTLDSVFCEVDDDEVSVEAMLRFAADGGERGVSESGPKHLNGLWAATKSGRSGWRPSIHMPRWASRITLEITGVRVERLQDISEEDARAEGLACVTKDGSLYKYGISDLDGLPGNDNHGWHWQEWERDPRNAYHKLWEQINGPGSAVANPWVWVIEFKRVEAKP